MISDDFEGGGQTNSKLFLLSLGGWLFIDVRDDTKGRESDVRL